MQPHPNQLLIIILLIIYILSITFIGIRNSHSKDSEDYFLASRNLPSWLLAVTFIASWWGGGSAIDLVDHAHEDGMNSFWIYGVPVLLSTFLMFLFAGGIRRIATISQPELIEKRYDGRCAFLLSVFIIIFMVIASAVQVIVIGNFFHSFFNISYTSAAVIGTGVVFLYSMFGGFRGVVLTDLLQFCFFLVSSIFLFILSYSMSGGFNNIVLHAAKIGKTEYTSFFYNVGGNIAYVITFGAAWMVQANVWQRISAARSPRDARKMMIISFFVFIPLYFMVTLTGMSSSVSYPTIPKGGIVANLLLNYPYPIVSAIIFVGLCSAIMSTMDSMFNTGALSMTVDIYKRYISPNSSSSHYVVIGRISTFIIAGIALLIGIKIKSVLIISWIGSDFIATGAFVPLVAGFIWKRGTSTAAFYTMVFGILFSTYNLLVALGLGLPVLWKIASVQQALIGMLASLFIFISLSYCSKVDLKKSISFINTVRIFSFSSKNDEIK